MKNEIENLVGIIENKSKKYQVGEIVGVCKRINNSKRDFLFVNKYQGKHFPQHPSKILGLFDEFIGNIESTNEKVLVIGFAETATAIGNYVSAKLPNCVFEMQTTRELIKEERSIIEFREDHSHAPTQLLYGSKDVFHKVDRVIFVEDEITTGKTIINFINEIKKINSNLKYAVASILNWQDEETSELYKKFGIDTYYLIKGKIKDINAKVDAKVLEEEKFGKNNNKIQCYNIPSNLCNLKSTRIGRTPIKNVDDYSNKLFNEIANYSKLIQQIKLAENQNILVLGTEEFMYEPLLFASYLEKNTKNNIFYQATTRSPIEVSDEQDYILNKRYKFSSCYEETRTTYLYNLKKYDKVFIITDSVNNEFIEYMSDIFGNLGCNLDNVEIIKLGGNNEQFS